MPGIHAGTVTLWSLLVNGVQVAEIRNTVIAVTCRYRQAMHHERLAVTLGRCPQNPAVS